MQLAHIIHFETMVEQVVKYVLSITKFFIPTVDIVRKLVDKLFEDQPLKNMDRASTLTMVAELLNERFSWDLCKPSK